MSDTPFNWCDYRCERCESTKDCRVYKDESAIRLKYILQGRDPDSMEATLETVAESFSKAKEMLEEMCIEKGISWEEIKKEAKDAPPPRNFKEDPLFKTGQQVADEAHSFLKWAEDAIYISPEINEYFYELGYYSRLIPAKFARIASVDEFDDDGEDEFMAEDRRKTLEVIQKAVNICRESLRQISTYRPETIERVERIEKLLEGILIQK